MRFWTIVFVAMILGCGAGDGGKDTGVADDAAIDDVADDPGTPGSDDTGGQSGSDDPISEPSVYEPVMDLDALLGHLDALQSIADANNGHRSAGTSGFDASVEYVVEELGGMGYEVSFQEFEVAGLILNGPSEMRMVTPESVEFEFGHDFSNFGFTGAGSLIAPVVAVDVMVPPADESNTSTSGCEATDFDGFSAGSIALVQRGTCRFQDKMNNAVAAGAVALLMFNEGQSGRTDLFPATLAADSPEDVPGLVLTYEIGAQLALLAAEQTVELEVVVDVTRESFTTVNAIAETEGVSEDVVVVGAHLDSVGAGPGINDNGSGVSLVLELARWMATGGEVTQNSVRFVLWGAEELGLLGSFAYVEELSDAQHSTILANLNFDMVASPNPVRFIYDGDGSHTGDSGPAGSDEIEALFTDWFDAVGLNDDATPFDGRSDYGPFIWSGIPAGGLFTGAEGIMSTTEAATYDGESGLAYDACYHQACDTNENIDPGMYIQMADAALNATLILADRDGGFGSAGPPSLDNSGLSAMPLTIGGCHGATEVTR
jgi:Zn-dependent M28 family amino/carboxypeptidase